MPKRKDTKIFFFKPGKSRHLEQGLNSATCTAHVQTVQFVHFDLIRLNRINDMPKTIFFNILLTFHLKSPGPDAFNPENEH